jgi:hypothetical protein
MLAGSGEFDSWDLEQIGKDLDADIVVYYYVYGSYEGSGFAAFVYKDKYGYTDLGHCSCYGPVDDLRGVKACYTLEEVEKIAEKNYSEEHGPAVVERLKELINEQAGVN